MSMSAHDIYVENFRESVRIYQQCIMWCIAASFSGLLLAWKMFQMPDGEVLKTRIPVLFWRSSLAGCLGGWRCSRISC